MPNTINHKCFVCRPNREVVSITGIWAGAIRLLFLVHDVKEKFDGTERGSIEMNFV